MFGQPSAEQQINFSESVLTITMLSAYYLTSREDSSMGKRGPCIICSQPCKNPCRIYGTKKVSAGLRGRQRWRDKLSQPATCLTRQQDAMGQMRLLEKYGEGKVLLIVSVG